MTTRSKDRCRSRSCELLVANMYRGRVHLRRARPLRVVHRADDAGGPAGPRTARPRSRALARLWAVVYVANLIGAAAFAGLAVLIGPGTRRDRAASVRRNRPPPWSRIPRGVIFLSGLLAGWLMGLLSWLVAAGRDTISQIVLIWLIGDGDRLTPTCTTSSSGRSRCSPGSSRGRA